MFVFFHNDECEDHGIVIKITVSSFAFIVELLQKVVDCCVIVFVCQAYRHVFFEKEDNNDTTKTNLQPQTLPIIVWKKI